MVAYFIMDSIIGLGCCGQSLGGQTRVVVMIL